MGLMFGDLSFSIGEWAKGVQFRPIGVLAGARKLESERFMKPGELPVIELLNPKLPFSDTFIDIFRFGEGSGRLF